MSRMLKRHLLASKVDTFIKPKIENKWKATPSQVIGEKFKIPAKQFTITFTDQETGKTNNKKKKKRCLVL